MMRVGWASEGAEIAEQTEAFAIEGKVTMPRDANVPKNWRSYTRVLVNYGQFVGFLREDGSFVISQVPSGSYVVEVASKDYVFEPVRVDITSKGKIRGRRLNFLQPSAVSTVQYPLKLIGRQPANYFRKREEWRITDMLMNPMVLMMVLPLLLIVVLPKLINTNDPELQREMAQSMQMPKYEMPELSEMMTSFFGGGGAKKAKKTTTTKKRT
uniref:ER membrane protein complex subunit 7 beta-sandwich domain-containing protein n=1 Tax=Plectus sambesii TaxID=2011161 RepID=A0A914WFY3_9BILA